MFDSYSMPIRPSGIMLATTDKNVLKKPPLVHSEMAPVHIEEQHANQDKSVIELLLIIAGLK